MADQRPALRGQGRRIILGMGSGRCGTRSLASLLDAQPGAKVSHEEHPLLMWRSANKEKIVRRLERMLRSRTEPVIGDVASFYLPYVEAALEFDPGIRIACLKRPREEVVQSFCQWLDKVHPLPTNHWAKRPAVGWHHEPIWTQIFPQYETIDRLKGIGRYWDEYYERAGELAKRFPEQVRVFDWLAALNTLEGQRDLLSFCGFADDEQVVSLDIHENQGETAPVRTPEAKGGSHPTDPRRCVVIVPYVGKIADACERCLAQLAERGYPIWRVEQFAAIDQVRSQLATDALIKGFAETLWIDEQAEVDSADVERIRAKGEAVVCRPLVGEAAAPASGAGAIVGAAGASRGQTQAGKFALIHVRREVYERLQWELELPVCVGAYNQEHVPFFLPVVHEGEAGPVYLNDAWSFLERARSCGFAVSVERATHKPKAVAKPAGAPHPQPLSPEYRGEGSQNESGGQRGLAESRTRVSEGAVKNFAAKSDVARIVGGACPPDQCAILVPVSDYVEPACDASLRALEARGYQVVRAHGYKQIDLGRSQMATDALAAGFHETLWIDADTAFHPDVVERLRSRDVPIVCGVYPKKSKREFAIHAMPGTKLMQFGVGGGLVEILYASTGFLLVRREVYEQVRKQHELPLCAADTGRTLIPFFAPLVRPDGEGWWYLAEDFAFSERARQCGYKILADTTVRLLHIGKYDYGWEDAGREVKRYSSYKFNLQEGAKREEPKEGASRRRG
jgi:hypothetical protein